MKYKNYIYINHMHADLHTTPTSMLGKPRSILVEYNLQATLFVMHIDLSLVTDLMLLDGETV